ncbi:membrane protein, putative [Oceanicola granulosus HTCC2516]|uniref:Probable membrane transporter protein n=1 Tax=Oceanicola granulosus (strain ATCC BAA-861 / DSM 15982 / KCTC 12143 / HTCC2516) TaxID=314256 RepID=Q2CI33_OCEGH|nr:sulfite exporter TauE/SafE family protein [Oceanicola granulosus]EAR52425.1 membrane protein, putative [Oceanicola granulosus HTCC2516]
MSFDLVFFALAVPAVLFAAVSKAGFGSGAAFAAAAILALAMPPGLALGMMLPLLMLVDVAALRAYRGQWHRPSALGIILGAIPGVALGAWLYLVVPADLFRVLIGLMCLLFVGYQIARERGWLRIGKMPFSWPLAGLTGTFVGFTSFVSHAGGPPAAVFLLSQSLGKTTFQATTVIIFWAVNLMKVIPYAMIGIFTADTLLAALLLAPVALAGTWLGVRAHHWVSERVFFGLTYVLLVVTGVRLIWVGLG